MLLPSISVSNIDNSFIRWGTSGTWETPGAVGTSGADRTDGTSRADGADGTSRADGTSGADGTYRTYGTNGTYRTAGTYGRDRSPASAALSRRFSSIPRRWWHMTIQAQCPKPSLIFSHRPIV